MGGLVVGFRGGGGEVDGSDGGLFRLEVWRWMGLMVGLGWRWGDGWVWWCVLGWRWRDGWVWDGGAEVGGVLGI